MDLAVEHLSVSRLTTKSGQLFLLLLHSHSDYQKLYSRASELE